MENTMKPHTGEADFGGRYNAKQLPVKLVLLSPLGKQVTLYLKKLEIRFYYIRMLCVNFGLHWATDYTERLFFPQS